MTGNESLTNYSLMDSVDLNRDGLFDKVYKHRNNRDLVVEFNNGSGFDDPLTLEIHQYNNNWVIMTGLFSGKQYDVYKIDIPDDGLGKMYVYWPQKYDYEDWMISEKLSMLNTNFELLDVFNPQEFTKDWGAITQNRSDNYVE